MALREFVDRHGIEWKVWDITPESMHPVTMQEFFLGEYQEGWLAFESPTERRRLSRWPTNWFDLPDSELEKLCAMAVSAPRRSGQETRSGAFRRFAETGTLAKEEEELGGSEKESPPLRTFTGPSGRHWMVTPMELGSGAETRVVLRFTANDGTVLDLEEFPDDWDRYGAAQLVELARRAEPVRPDVPGDPPLFKTDDRGI